MPKSLNPRFRQQDLRLGPGKQCHVDNIQKGWDRRDLWTFVIANKHAGRENVSDSQGSLIRNPACVLVSDVYTGN